MATGNQGQPPSRLRYELETYSTSSHDDDSMFTVRRNGKLFYIRVSPSQFVDSPETTSKYMSYLELLRSGEQTLGDILDTDVFEWVTRPFLPLFDEHAPSPAPPDRHSNIRVTLRQHLLPDFFVFDLYFIKERPQPRQVLMNKPPYVVSNVWLDEEFLDDVETWSALYDPANIILSFDDARDALFKPPQKVLVDSGQTACFFKRCHSPAQTKAELQTYKKIAATNLDARLCVCRLHGVVLDDDGFIAGLLLIYIDGRPLSTLVDPQHPSASTRRRWFSQISVTLAELHKIGVTWGDVKVDNVLVDRGGRAWIIDFGGGYTRGWVDSQMAGTVDGDLAGMAKLREYIFQDEAQHRWW
jgi:hypothetical protein